MERWVFYTEKIIKMRTTITITALLLTTLFAGCVERTNYEKSKQRIILKETNFIDGNSMRILEVDGVEYIQVNDGGICPLVKNK